MPSPLAKEQLAGSLLKMLDAFRFDEQRREKGKNVQKIREETTLRLIASNVATIVRDLQHILSLRPAQMTRVLRSLERQECIMTSRNEEDHRMVDVALTGKGVEEAHILIAQRTQSLLLYLKNLRLGTKGCRLMMEIHRQITDALGATMQSS